MFDQLLKYDLGKGVEAFSTQRDAVLPYEVTQGHQVHGSRVAIIDRAGMTREELEGYDAFVTNLPGVAIGVRTADCVPVLIAAIEAMKQEFSCAPADMKAVIGPSIGPDSFQVGEEVATHFKEAGFPMERIWSFQGPKGPKPMSGGHHIDLWKANAWLLEQAGIPSENIHTCGIDTYTTEAYFSVRREGVQCGRIINSIKLI